MITAQLSTRSDAAGAGHFGAPRGNRKHKGQDYACLPATEILAPVPDGQVWSVSKLGYPYGDDLSYRYVEIRDLNDRRHRVFYVEPSVELHDMVTSKTVIGKAQDVTKRYPQYPAMTPHVHYEIMLSDDSCVDPTT